MMTALTSMVDYNIDDGLAILTLDNPPVNALSQGVRQGLKEGVEKALADTTVSAILIICKGRTFIAGADISEFGSAPKAPDFHAVLNTMDNSNKPIIAAIHGTALGGGLETALCCNYRVAVAEAKFGLPEVNLGLLPGAGGTQRLPRIVGAEKALAMVTTGIPIGAPEALKLGLIDKIVSGDLHAEAVAFARQKGVEGLLHPRIRDRDDRLQSARDNPEVFAAVRKMIAPKSPWFYCARVQYPLH